jgi:hypothetical protein
MICRVRRTAIDAFCRIVVQVKRGRHARASAPRAASTAARGPSPARSRSRRRGSRGAPRRRRPARGMFVVPRRSTPGSPPESSAPSMRPSVGSKSTSCAGSFRRGARHARTDGSRAARGSTPRRAASRGRGVRARGTPRRDRRVTTTTVRSRSPRSSRRRSRSSRMRSHPATALAVERSQCARARPGVGTCSPRSRRREKRLASPVLTSGCTSGGCGGGRVSPSRRGCGPPCSGGGEESADHRRGGPTRRIARSPHRRGTSRARGSFAGGLSKYSESRRRAPYRSRRGIRGQSERRDGPRAETRAAMVVTVADRQALPSSPGNGGRPP